MRGNLKAAGLAGARAWVREGFFRTCRLRLMGERKWKVSALTSPEAPLTTVRTILSGSAVGERVRLRGWLSNKRSSGGIVFLIMRDGTGWLQLSLIHI